MTIDPFTVAVLAALDARKAASAPGPRTLSDLAREIGIGRGSLHLRLSGKRPMLPHLRVAILAALPEVRDDD